MRMMVQKNMEVNMNIKGENDKRFSSRQDWPTMQKISNHILSTLYENIFYEISPKLVLSVIRAIIEINNFLLHFAHPSIIYEFQCLTYCNEYTILNHRPELILKFVIHISRIMEENILYNHDPLSY